MRPDHLSIEVVAAAAEPRDVPVRAQARTGRFIVTAGWRARLRVPRRARYRDALVVVVDRRRDDPFLVYGQFAFLPLPPHQKYEPQLPPLRMCDSMP